MSKEKKLIAGEYVDGLAQRLGKFCARTAFRGSDLSLQTADKKSDTALFQGNLALMGITESLVFTEPYFAAEMNHHTDGLDPIVRILRSDVEMKTEAQKMLLKFTANTETLCHGDLHSGQMGQAYLLQIQRLKGSQAMQPSLLRRGR